MIDQTHLYDQDGLRTRHNHEFMNDPAFQAAYARGVQASELDYNIHWRIHTALWAARLASHLEGDFVECGVAKGFVSSAIMRDLNWDRTGRLFWLLDTFAGIDTRYVSAAELEQGAVWKNQWMIDNGYYATGVDPVAANFAEWRNVRIVAGPIPETLGEVSADRIAYLHLDLNCAPPEIAAAAAFWERLAPGAPVLLDDYAYEGYREQKLAMDAFAAGKGLSVLSLPTGQGLLMKPARASAI